MKTLVAIGALAAALAVPSLPVVAQETDAGGSTKVTDKDHPDFIKCRMEKVLGSLAKRRKTCLTNRQWEEFARRGNDNARKTVEQWAVGGPNSQ